SHCLYSIIIAPPPTSTLFPYTTLFRSVISQSPTAGASVAQASRVRLQVSKGPTPVAVPNVIGSSFDTANSTLLAKGFAVSRTDVDRKSTRLNSSHVAISYAGFCLNKKI